MLIYWKPVESPWRQISLVKYKDRFGSSIRMRVLFNVCWTQTVNDSPASLLPSFPYSKQFSNWKPGMTREEQKVFGGLAAANCKIYYETFGACGGVSCEWQYLTIASHLFVCNPSDAAKLQGPSSQCTVLTKMMPSSTKLDWREVTAWMVDSNKWKEDQPRTTLDAIPK